MPAGYKPPKVANEQEDVEIRSHPLLMGLIAADAKDEGNGDVASGSKETETAEVEGTPNSSIKLMMTEANAKATEPAKKKRRVVVEDSDEEVALETIPSPPNSTEPPKSAPKATKKVSGIFPSTTKPPPKPIE